MNKPNNINLVGNSPSSRDVAFHMHPYTNPAQLEAAGPHIISKVMAFLYMMTQETVFMKG